MMPDILELRRDFLFASQACPLATLSQTSQSGSRQPAVIAIGVFDGLHAGHQTLLAHMCDDAHARGVEAWVITFDPDPDRVVSRHPALHLMDTQSRLGALRSCGADGVAVVPFTREVAAMDHVRFFQELVFPSFEVQAIHVGSDFRLGSHGASDVEVIRSWCAPQGITVHGHELLRDDGSPISATRIRAALASGSLAMANRELGRRYMVRGRVRTGRGQGTDMGFPTANIEADPTCQMPLDGVYAGFALVGDTVWSAAINVGLPPTYRDRPEAASLEANLLGFSGDIYGDDIALSFDERLRASRTFESQNELVKTVLGNIDDIRQRFGEHGVVITCDQR